MAETEEGAINRLQAKSPEKAIVERISRDFNLALFMARTQFEQMREYFEEYFGLQRDVGQMTVLAASAENPLSISVMQTRFSVMQETREVHISHVLSSVLCPF